MTRVSRRAVVLVFAAVAGAGAGVSAQWIRYPTAGVPRTRDGKPDLTAPRPAHGRRQARFLRCVGERRLHAGQRRAWARHRGPCSSTWHTRSAAGRPINRGPARSTIAARTRTARTIPTRAACRSGRCRCWRIRCRRRSCSMPGLARAPARTEHGVPADLSPTAGPCPTDPNPSWYGYSTARWDGDTLVVDTNGLRDGLWADFNGSPLTDQAKIRERFRRPNYGTLDVQVTIDDPKAYTRPFTVAVNAASRPEHGSARVRLPRERERRAAPGRQIARLAGRPVVS